MGLMDAFKIGSKGLMVHSKRMDIHANNMANIDTPGYVRKIPVLHSKDDISFKGLLNNMKETVFGIGTIPFEGAGVSYSGTVNDPTQGERIYKPGHPDADKEGYIRTSNVNPLVDMADAMMTSRAYEASLAVVSITKAMAQRATEIGK